jgi:hypothetical protein
MIERTPSLLGSEIRYRWPRTDGALALDGELAGELITVHTDRDRFMVPVATKPDLHMHHIEPTADAHDVPTQEYRCEQIAARDLDGNAYLVPVLAAGPRELLESHLKLFEFLTVTLRAWWLGRIWWIG